MGKVVAVIGLTNNHSINILDIDTDNEKVIYRINNGKTHVVKLYLTNNPYFMCGTTRIRLCTAMKVG
ncbi:hypothetical protein [Liquorilactobacillus mali]|uniref:hypothetical protein n=1 Tax=Liquorilactobacillus mali TaxID=1618 RepID=UPI00024916F4|nr:hypothetical protein [Liquorilactobacillus mali]